DRPRTPALAHRAGVCRTLLPRTAHLAAFCREQQATLFMALLATYAALLARWSGEEDLVVGSPIANRNRVETEGLIGFFVNMLPLRVDLAGPPSFTALVAQIRETTLAAHPHQDLPFEKLVEALQPQRHFGRTPLFQVSFVLQNARFKAVEIPGLSWNPLLLETGAARFDLSLSLAEQAGGLAAALVFKTDLFDAATGERLLGSFGRLLAAAVATPDLRLGELSLLSAAERHALLCESNDTERLPGEDLPIHRVFEQRAAAIPETLALVAGAESLTFGELDRRANAVAHRLRRQGVGPESRVGLVAGRSAGTLVGLLGILKAGGAYVPVDPVWPAERLRWVLADSGTEILLDGADLSAADSAVAPDAGIDLDDPDNAAYVLYTSGSTGRPKGVVVRHRSVLNLARALRDDVYGAELRPLRVGVNASLAFDGSVKQLVQLLWGHTLYLIPEEARLEPSALVDLVRQEGLDVLDCTPSQLRLLLAAGLASDPQEGPRLVLVGGEPIDRETWESAGSRTCTRFVNVYGPTECTVDTTACPFPAMASPGTLGRPLANVRVHAVDRQGGLVPVGVAGEIWIGGAGLARGYSGRPDLTAERFVPDPFDDGPGARLYRSGDLARRLADGSLEFLGRTDHQVKVRGFRIEPGEIEAALSLHPQVRETVVVARDVAGTQALVAYVGSGESRPTAAELRTHLRARLPEYMLPAVFVVLSGLPWTPNGKVDRQALPDPEREPSSENLNAPRTQAEELLAGIWAELLGLERVGIHDSFFDLGGHSLLGTRLMSRIESRLGIALPLRALFETPTVEALATRIEQALGGETDRLAPPLVAGPRPERLPLSFAQERLWFLDQIDGPSAVYNIPCAVYLTGALDTAALGRALDEVVRRHEVLRTRFEVDSGEPRQVIEPPLPVPLTVVDIAGASEAEALRLAISEARRPFDLTRPPMLRALLLRRSAEDHLLVLTLHHIASDGWSTGVLVGELVALYRGEALAELPVQYADFALWQRSWLAGETLEQEVAWWRERLAGAPEEIPLLGDRPRTAALSNQGATCRSTLPLSADLSSLRRERQATLFMVLLATYASLLARWSGEEDLVVGSPVANRNRVETEGLIGFFVNMLPLRIDFAGGPTFADLLARVRETTLAAHAHQDLPFEKLVEALQPQRRFGRTPLFQVSLVFQNARFKAVEVPDLSWSPLLLETGAARFDLSLSLTEQAEGL
ncbi:MAG TPA: amino acid adenylation domain-containing protein, partial [Thermoanaerobaculia bacterium]|nr:amino acid adenylation domain-containing protein [Thermoanaerobaculia bacterium]